MDEVLCCKSNNVTTANDNDDFNQMKKTTWHVAIGFVLPVVIAIGLVGNVLCLVVIRRRWKQLTEATRIRERFFKFLTCLAVTDTCVLLGWVGEVVTWGWQINDYRHYWLSVYFTYISFPLINAATMCSALMITLITLDRFLVICCWFRMGQRFTNISVTKLVAPVVAVSICMVLPSCFERGIVVQHHGGDTIYRNKYNCCVADTDYVYLMARVACIKILPIVAIFVLNAAIFRALWTNNNRHHEQTKSTVGNRKDFSTLAMLSTVSFAFIFFMFPEAIWLMVRSPETLRQLSWVVFQAAANVMEAANSAANFYLYAAASPKFRRQFLTICTCRAEGNTLTGQVNYACNDVAVWLSSDVELVQYRRRYSADAVPT